MTGIKTVGVLGGGLMGNGIAQVAAAAGYTVTLRDIDDGAIGRARKMIEGSLAKFVEKGKLPAAARDTTLGLLGFTTDLDALSKSDLIIEAVTEDLALKNKLWKELDEKCPPGTIFASNTSSLPIVAMAAATKRPDRFVGMHFFNPVPVMQLVEVVKAVGTSQETFDRAFAFAKSLGKEAIVAKDTPGFVVNRLLVPYMVDAIRAFENGVGSVSDIDIGMKLGAGHPIGPLALTDLVGLDTALRVSDILYAEFSEQRYSAPPLLRRLVTAGHLGRKTGRGFYDYSVDPARPAL
jgi:3-hydroxybutyryl-CoA dehydrogenase